ncbi:MAG: hypothetical protein ACI4R5_08600, partial [Acetatifactor sp.]
NKYYLKNKAVEQDEREGGRFETFSAPIAIMANIYDDTGGTTPTALGVTREYKKVMLLDVPYTIQYDTDNKQERYLFNGNSMAVGDGICVYVLPENNPDFRVVSISPAGHLVCRLERI